jgi:riboflavin kinase / FMN adenylyltransferase
MNGFLKNYMQYTISGTVIHGDGYGRKLGFPTVNLEIGDQKIPEAGVYAGNAILENKKYLAGIVVNPEGRVEAHLIGYDGDAYGNTVILEIKKFIREYKNFKTEGELIEQIKKDIHICSQV